MVEEKEVTSSQMADATINSVAYDQMEFNNWNGHGDMNLELYYANLAEGLMMEPPIEGLNNLDDHEWGEAASLWNW